MRVWVGVCASAAARSARLRERRRADRLYLTVSLSRRAAAANRDFYIYLCVFVRILSQKIDPHDEPRPVRAVYGFIVYL